MLKKRFLKSHFLRLSSLRSFLICFMIKLGQSPSLLLYMPKKKPATSDLKINFLKGDGTSVAGNIVNWISRFGLPVMFVVAAVVLGTAIYKLYLDQQVIALENQIVDEANTTKSFAALEKELNAITSKYNDVTEFWLAEKTTLLLPKLTVVIPPEVTLNELSITPESVRFSGFAVDKGAYNRLFNNIKAIENTKFPDNQKVVFDNLRLEEVSSTSVTEAGFSFSIRFNYTITEENDTSTEELSLLPIIQQVELTRQPKKLNHSSAQTQLASFYLERRLAHGA